METRRWDRFAGIESTFGPNSLKTRTSDTLLTLCTLYTCLPCLPVYLYTLCTCIHLYLVYLTRSNA